VDCDFLLEACTKGLSLSEGKKREEIKTRSHFCIKVITDPTRQININNGKFETRPSSPQNFGMAQVISHSESSYTMDRMEVYLCFSYFYCKDFMSGI